MWKNNSLFFRRSQRGHFASLHLHLSTLFHSSSLFFCCWFLSGSFIRVCRVPSARQIDIVAGVAVCRLRCYCMRISFKICRRPPFSSRRSQYICHFLGLCLPQINCWFHLSLSLAPSLPHASSFFALFESKHHLFYWFWYMNDDRHKQFIIQLNLCSIQVWFLSGCVHSLEHLSLSLAPVLSFAFLYQIIAPAHSQWTTTSKWNSQHDTLI